MRSTLLSLFALAPLALADVEFTYPAAGASIPAGAVIVKWEESGIAPKISLLESYTLQLMVGGNDAAEAMSLISASGTFANGNEVSGTITPTLASSLTNGFYFQMISTAKDGGTVTNYSGRFTISGMTGTTPAKYVQQVSALGGSTAGPPTVDDVTPGAAAPAASLSSSSSLASSLPAAVEPTTKGRKGGGGVAETPAADTPAAVAASYTVPYNLQTGIVRYAPMQPIPPTKITANNPSPLFPTSAFDIARSKLPPATVVTTYTLAQTYSVQSVVNSASPQSNPRDDMAKYLNRWKD